MLSSEVQNGGQTKATRANVLIVEDERVSRRALAALMSASGYETEAAASAEEALSAVASGVHPDIALVDLDLPVFPVLITAANGDNLTSLLQQRGVAYLRKPVDFDRLMSLLTQKPA